LATGQRDRLAGTEWAGDAGVAGDDAGRLAAPRRTSDRSGEVGDDAGPGLNGPRRSDRFPQ